MRTFWARAISSSETEDEKALASPFLKFLTRLIRIEDINRSWEGKSDAEVLAHFILSKKQRSAISIIGSPDPFVLWRLEVFYAAVGLMIEERSGLTTSPMMKISHEGSGRVLLTAGRLVLLSKILCEVHRFGYETLTQLAEAGTKLVDEAMAAIEAYPDAARA
ncbi:MULTISPECIES: NifX-associated nitrogen fixation protein [unclassified Sinorhizobium]|uniref:NifX-associated nitrogen fixation protein n=1 Tax=unclassified Sinorhizobium TaxID=2613772 RepID=UPI0024C311D7|nr:MULTISPECIES: NifX-associated nitrogen fixation protein [unclassified Sinorhizobium]MDK1378250.1 NifX-associated nitrogen fixation protein [Sinorhizobium sp. 6-70]MDK1480367.1 NifX-associated nitrogen fixation protein [Sinorhizobium sp. 6-117]